MVIHDSITPELLAMFEEDERCFQQNPNDPRLRALIAKIEEIRSLLLYLN